MAMRVEMVDARTLPVILDWWKIRGEGEIPEDVLPPVGMVAMDGDGPAAAAWIYQPAGCKVAILDWMVTRPWMRQEESREACRALLMALEARADSDGASMLFASAARGGMVREAQACGFHVAADRMTHLVKMLKS